MERRRVWPRKRTARWPRDRADDGDAQLISDCSALAGSMGTAGAAKALGISAARLRTVLNGKAGADHAMAQLLASRLPGAMQLCEKLRIQRSGDLQRVRELVRSSGLRSAARQLGVDPSNLKRKLSAKR